MGLKTSKIYIYKTQINRFRLINLLKQSLGECEFFHSKFDSRTTLKGNDWCTVSVHERRIIIQYTESACEAIAYQVKDVLINKLNAEKIYFQSGETEEMISLPSYKPTLINRFRYRLIKMLQD